MSDVTEGNDDVSGNADGIDLDAPEVKAAIAEAVKAAKGGLEKKNKELLGKVKAAQESAKAWEGLDPEKTREVLNLFESNEDAKLIAEGKHEEAWAKRREKLDAEHKKQLDDMSGLLESAKSKESALSERLKVLQIDGKLTEVGVKLGVTAAAMPDFIRRGRDVWHLNDEGEPVALNGDAELHSRDKPTELLSMEEWTMGLKKPLSEGGAPHFFVSVDSSGGNAGGSGDASGGGRTISRERFDDMGHADQKKYVKSGGKITD